MTRLVVILPFVFLTACVSDLPPRIDTQCREAIDDGLVAEADYLLCVETYEGALS